MLGDFEPTLTQVEAPKGDEADGADDRDLVKASEVRPQRELSAEEAGAAEPEEEPEGEQAPSAPVQLSPTPPLTPGRAVTTTDLSQEDWPFQTSSPFRPRDDGPVVVDCSPADCQVTTMTAILQPPVLSLQPLVPLLQPPVPPPPASCFPVCASGAPAYCDSTPCLVELAASAASSSSRTTECLDGGGAEDGPAWEECERLLPGLLMPGTCRSGSSRSSPGAGGSSRCDVGGVAAASPREGPGSNTSLARFLSPMSSCAPSPAKAPTAPAPSPVREHVAPSSASSSWCPPPQQAGRNGGEVADILPHAAPAAANDTTTWPPATPRDAGAWFRAARRTLLPLSGPVLGRLPSLERLIEVADISRCFTERPITEPAVASSAGPFACWCTPMSSAKAVDFAAASSIPATEDRLFSVPRPSMRGLRATSTDCLTAQLDRSRSADSTPRTMKPLQSASSQCQPAPATAPDVRRVLRPPATAQRAVAVSPSVCEPVSPIAAITAADVAGYESSALASEQHSLRLAPHALMPALPKQAPALPSRAPSGDNAADAAELLLARVVNPFGEDG